MKTTITLIVLFTVTIALVGCGQTNSQDNIKVRKGGIVGLIIGDEAVGNGTGSNNVPEALAADKSNTQIRKEQNGSNDSLLKDDRSGDGNSRRSRRESQSLLD